jgi:hypothetical protein
MNLEERYNASALNSRNTAYNGTTQFANDTSKLNVDRIPSRYNLAGAIAAAKDTSKLNVDRIPSRYNLAGAFASAKDTSKLNLDQTPSRYSPK